VVIGGCKEKVLAIELRNTCQEKVLVWNGQKKVLPGELEKSRHWPVIFSTYN
jgi:hypothetical protein